MRFFLTRIFFSTVFFTGLLFLFSWIFPVRTNNTVASLTQWRPMRSAHKTPSDVVVTDISSPKKPSNNVHIITQKEQTTITATKEGEPINHTDNNTLTHINKIIQPETKTTNKSTTQKKTKKDTASQKTQPKTLTQEEMDMLKIFEKNIH